LVDVPSISWAITNSDNVHLKSRTQSNNDVAFNDNQVSNEANSPYWNASSGAIRDRDTKRKPNKSSTKSGENSAAKKGEAPSRNLEQRSSFF
jgi:hypothetical protein